MGRGGRRLLFWLLPWLILSPGGCAYFNTFFYAKKNYAKAQRIEEGSTTDRLSPEAVKSYDQAIEKCNKVILGYGGGWRAGIDDALFLMGQCYYGKREYETAIGKFDEVILNYPDSDHVPEALFYAGLCYHHLRNFGTATQIFDGLLTQYPHFERRDEILFVAAEGLETAGDFGGALKQYALILERFPESRRREDALERVGTIHFEAAHYDSALEAYSVLARTSRDDALYIEAQFRRGSCLVRLNRPAEALEIYERILPDDAERQELGGRAWLAMA
ncbi:MAG: tetratricopeptide repeat protein, partial [Candidatus Eisenbacteria bacterium]